MSKYGFIRLKQDHRSERPWPRGCLLQAWYVNKTSGLNGHDPVGICCRPDMWTRPAVWTAMTPCVSAAGLTCEQDHWSERPWPRGCLLQVWHVNKTSGLSGHDPVRGCCRRSDMWTRPWIWAAMTPWVCAAGLTCEQDHGSERPWPRGCLLQAWHVNSGYTYSILEILMRHFFDIMFTALLQGTSKDRTSTEGCRVLWSRWIHPSRCLRILLILYSKLYYDERVPCKLWGGLLFLPFNLLIALQVLSKVTTYIFIGEKGCVCVGGGGYVQLLADKVSASETNQMPLHHN